MHRKISTCIQRHARSACVAVCAAACATAADAAPAVTTAVKPSSPIIVRMADVPGTMARIAGSPMWRVMSGSAWGKALGNGICGRLASVDDRMGFHTIPSRMSSLTIGMDIGLAGEYLVGDALWSDTAAPRSMFDHVDMGSDPRAVAAPAAGFAAREYAAGEWGFAVGGPLPPTTSPLPAMAKADVSFRLDLKGIIGAVRAKMALGAEAPYDLTIDGGVDWSKDGVRESWSMPLAVGRRPLMVAAGATTARSIDPQEVVRVPPGTIWSLVIAPDDRALASFADDAGMRASMSTVLAQAKLKADGFDPLAILAGLGDRIRIVVEEGRPLPTVTVQVAMKEPQAKILVARIGDEAKLAAGADGIRSGFAGGMIPLSCGWIDGDLVLSTDPDGLRAAVKRLVDARRDGAPTAADGPAAKRMLAAIAGLPGHHVVMGFSDSSKTIGLLAGNLVPHLTGLVGPSGSGMPADIMASATTGWISCRSGDDVFRCDASGLIGGPIALWLQMNMLGHYVAYRDRVVAAVNAKNPDAPGAGRPADPPHVHAPAAPTLVP